MSLVLGLDVTNSKIRELNLSSSGSLLCDSSATTQPISLASCPLPSGACTEATLSTLNGKVVACDTSSISGSVSVTGSVTVDGSGVTQPISATSLPLPSNAASETSLATVAGCVSAGVMQVSSGSVSASSSVVFGSVVGGTWTGSSIASNATLASTAFDSNSVKQLTIAGNCSDPSGSVAVMVSHDDVNYFELESEYLNVDYTSGDFGKSIHMSARYIKLKRTNNSASSETVKAFISGK